MDQRASKVIRINLRRVKTCVDECPKLDRYLPRVLTS